MSGLLQMRTISIRVPVFGPRLRDWVVAAARLIFWPLALLTLVSLAFQFGAWHAEYSFAGPFTPETDPPRGSMKLQLPQDKLAPWWVRPVAGDDGANPSQSSLELRINNREMGPPHAAHETIRDRKNAGFSHWGDWLIFSLPEGVANAPGTVLTLRYPLQPWPWVTGGLSIATALLAWFVFIRKFIERPVSRRGPWLRIQPEKGASATAVLVFSLWRIPYLVLAGLCWVGLAASAVYAASILYALATDWALPSTALIRWASLPEWAARKEPYFGHLLLMVAGAGTLATWLISSSSLHRPLLQSTEESMQRILARCGLPIAACAFVFCVSAMWAGKLRPDDFHYSNIGGLLPFSDASGYLAGAFDQVRDGVWNPIALRRPLAAAFRSVLLIFGGYSLPWMLILQACLIAGAACFATHAIVRWRGVWAGLAFFALTYIYDRIYVPTVLTEPAGLFWALLSIPFFVEAIRHRTASAALVAFAMTLAALMSRMGSMFTIPALLIWLIWQFGNGMAAKLRIGAAAFAVLVGVLGMNALLGKIYGTGHSSTGSNFSYTLCGLTIGTGWEGCPAKLAKEGKALVGDETAIADQLYAMAWTSFRAHPEIFFNRVLEGLQKFTSDVPDVIWRSYIVNMHEPDWLLPDALTAISLAGLLYLLARKANSVELSFWGLLWASIAASMAMIYFDGTSRALAASHPLMVMFFALGMSTPGAPFAAASPRLRMSRYGAAGLITAALLFVCVPWMAHRFFSPEGYVDAVPSDKKNEAFVFGGRRMSGFLVVDNGLPLRKEVPSIHLSDFEAFISLGGMETYQDLVHPVSPALPFGFVTAPRLERGIGSGSMYIVPPEVLERRDVPAWHFDLKRWGRPSAYGEYWFGVTKAEPWPPNSR